MLSRDGKKILRGVNLEVGDREIHSIIGANGAGKSTLAYTLMGLQGYEHEEGSLTFDGEDITKLSITERARKGITLAWQEPARFEGLKVRDYLAIGAKGNGGITEEKLKEALKKVDLKPEKYLDREVGEALSGGERKRIELASIITMKPKLAILDEPDSGIDVVSLKEIVALIQCKSWFSVRRDVDCYHSHSSNPNSFSYKRTGAVCTDYVSLLGSGLRLVSKIKDFGLQTRQASFLRL